MGGVPPPCGDTWVSQVVIALREIAQATALHRQKEIKADHEPESPVLRALRQSLWGAVAVAYLQHVHRRCPVRLGQPCHEHRRNATHWKAKQTSASLYRTLPASPPPPRPPSGAELFIEALPTPTPTFSSPPLRCRLPRERGGPRGGTAFSYPWGLAPILMPHICGQALGGGGFAGGGGLASPGRPTPPPTPEEFSAGKYGILSKGRKFVAEFRYTNFCGPDMPLASGWETGSQWESAPYQRPLSNTRPPHHRNSVGTCCVQRVAQ